MFALRSAKRGTLLDAEHLQQFDTVIFLGGCTGRRACAALDHQKRLQANVRQSRFKIIFVHLI